MKKTSPLIISPLALFELIIYPSFEAILPEFTGYYNGALSEFTVMDEVSLANGQPLIDMFGNQNFLKRKDASCKTDWSKVARTRGRKIYTQELYGAVENCQDEFYTGALKDFRKYNAKFRNYIIDFFRKGMGVDLAVNSYFGDVDRPDDDNAEAGRRWNWNKYDGVFKRIGNYIADGVIPAGQVMAALPSGEINPADAYDIFKDAYDKQDPIMDGLPDLEKGFYVDKKLAKAYDRYLQSIGQSSEKGVSYIKNGVPDLMFEGIPIYVEPIWDPVLQKLNAGTQAHSLVLTVSKNWVFGTNKNYGGGPDMNQGLRIWWSDDDEVWRQKMYLTGGTEILMPEYTVFGMTNI